MKKKIYLILIALIIVFGACTTKTSQKEIAGEIAEEISAKTITIGTVGEDASEIIALFQPTADYLAQGLSTEETKYTGKVVVARTVDEMASLLKEQRIDLYMESPFTALVVSKESGAVIFLRRWKKEVESYKSVIFTKKDSGIKSLEDLKGKTIAFEVPESSSGYLIPKAYLKMSGLDVSEEQSENGVKYVFSGEEVNTMAWVLESKADAGAIADTDFYENEELNDDLNIIFSSISVPRHVVVHRSGMETTEVKKIAEVFRSMDKTPSGIEVLKSFEKTTKYDDIPEKEKLLKDIEEILKYE